MVKYVREGAWRESPEQSAEYLRKIGFTGPSRYYPREKMQEAIMKIAKDDPRICWVAAEAASYGPQYAAAGIHPYRVMGFGIAEANTVVVASGLAKESLIPIYSNMSFLLGRSYNNIFQSVGTDNMNVKFFMNARGWAGGGASHHEINDIAIMRSIPQILIMAPADAVEMVAMVNAALKYIGAVFLRSPGQMGSNLFEEDYPFKIGKAFTVREGNDVSIISFGAELCRSLVASDILAKEGIEARVIDMGTIKPIDEDAIVKAAKDTGAIVTAEDHNILGGLGEAVAQIVVKNELVPMEMVGIRDRYSQSTTDQPGGWEFIEKAYNLTAEDIAAATRKVIKRKK